MRAARYHGLGDIRVEQVEEPKCGEGQVKVKPAFVGICGTGMLALSLFNHTDEVTSCSVNC
jgi:threonine dehydrogenase-like Zn-dependent dehydrogenase